MDKIIRIGTRDSELALWQAHTVEKKLNDLGYATEVIPTKSFGDIELTQPLYEMGITGIFTKTLDIALIERKIDIAVHSMKDVPTALPKKVVQTAVLKRANPKDILLYKGDLDFLNNENATIATGSLRRKAQWLHRYPTHTIENLRGNVNTRMQKLQDNDWNAAIFAAAGLERIEKLPAQHITLDWMIPAPAQGAMVVVAHEEDSFTIEATQKLNDRHTEICTYIERDFLRTLEGGCTAPIGAFAQIKDNQLHFKGALFSYDGKECLSVSDIVSLDAYTSTGKLFAQKILGQGGKRLMNRK